MIIWLIQFILLGLGAAYFLFTPSIVETANIGICSHCRTPRNFPDEIMIEICAYGGVARISYWQEVISDATPEGIAGAAVAGKWLTPPPEGRRRQARDAAIFRQRKTWPQGCHRS